ncbi:MAG: colanic acid biosynthesis glycosyltransferase WcaL [Chloroflexi bacterium]|nr:colanic acid biosynthesis glycosyltransferase WcaL [Chloroflexota bacterium]
MSVEKIVAIHSYPIWLPQTQTWMYNQVKYLPGFIDAHVVCDITANLEQFNLPNIHCLREISRPRLFAEKLLRKMSIRISRGHLASIAKDLEIDVLHSHFGNIGWNNQKTAERLSVKHIVTYYGYDVNRLPTEDARWLARYRELFQNADLFLCEGPHMAGRLVDLGCPRSKVRVHHLGVALDRISFQPRQYEAGEELQVLIVASFVEKKGIPYALAALAECRSEFPVRVTIIGDASSEKRSLEEKDRIMEILKDTGLAKVTRFLGYQPYQVVFEEAYRHHVFMSPSLTANDGDTEGGAPVTLIEMIATGMPVISTSHCDIPEVVQYKMPDWLVGERDVEGLKERLRLLVRQAGAWNRMLSTGRLHIEREFNAVEQGIRLAEIYAEVSGL